MKTEDTELAPEVGMSIVIPSYQRCDSLLRLITSLSEAIKSTDDLEVIVILDGTTDGSRSAMENISMACPFRYSWQQNSGRAAARNAGLALARGNVCWLIDDDMTVSREALVAHYDFHRSNPEPTVLMGPQLEQEISGSQAEFYSQRLKELSEAGIITDPFDFWTGNVSMPRKALLDLGGFNQEFVGWGEEDVELGFRLWNAGIPVKFEAAAGACHWRPRKFNTQVSEERERGRNIVRLYEAHPEAIVRVFFSSSLVLALHQRNIRKPWVYGSIARAAEILLRIDPFENSWLHKRAFNVGRSAARLAGVLDAEGSERLQRAITLDHRQFSDEEAADNISASPVSSAESNPARDEYETQGLLTTCGKLRDQSLVAGVIEDASFFTDAVEKLKAKNERRVPYAFTPAIRKLACDEGITGIVQDIFGDDEWVAWGANIQVGTPNAAHHWHNDIESLYWPSITVAVGLRGCRNNNATQYIPGTHRFSFGPQVSGDPGDTQLVLASARIKEGACKSVVRFSGFEDGSFAVFNARGWHCGDTEASVDRLVLFLHYQRASEPRIPYMRDYTENTWFSKSAAYLVNPSLGDRYEHAVYPSPVGRKTRKRRLLEFVRRVVRAGKPQVG